MDEKSDMKDFQENMRLIESALPTTSRLNKLVSERLPIYIEMMAAAYLQETNIPANDVELVVHYGIDTIKFRFERRDD